MTTRIFTRAMVTLLAGTVIAGITMPAVAETRVTDPFYTYDGSTPLSSYAPGDILKTRTVPYHVVNIPTPLQAVQVLYRSTNARGLPAANVTSILRPPNAQPGKVLSYHSIYNSLNPDHGPSRAIAGNAPIWQWTPSGYNFDIGGSMPSQEVTFFGPMLAAGYTVIIPDTEGPTADFAAGPEYGMMTLDSLRAARSVPDTGITDDDQIALMGYSGGSIATNWAAILAPDYAPDINDDLIGAAEGGVLVNPATNLRYINGSLGWAGVAGMAVVGIARAYDINFDAYLNDRGREATAQLADASILNIKDQYSGLTWQQMVKPEYTDPNSVPEFVEAVNKINMGTAPVPTIPMFIAQPADGIPEGTQPGGLVSGLVTASWSPATYAHSRTAIATLAYQSNTTNTTPSATLQEAPSGSQEPCSGLPPDSTEYPHPATAETLPPETPSHHNNTPPLAAKKTTTPYLNYI